MATPPDTTAVYTVSMRPALRSPSRQSCFCADLRPMRSRAIGLCSLLTSPDYLDPARWGCATCSVRWLAVFCVRAAETSPHNAFSPGSWSRRRSGGAAVAKYSGPLPSGWYTRARPAGPASRRIAAPTRRPSSPQCWHFWTMYRRRQRGPARPPPTGRRRFAARHGRRPTLVAKPVTMPRACELNRRRDALRQADADEKDMRRQTEAEIARLRQRAGDG